VVVARRTGIIPHAGADFRPKKDLCEPFKRLTATHLPADGARATASIDHRGDLLAGRRKRIAPLAAASKSVQGAIRSSEPGAAMN
jgi:hypothetical protein